MGMTTRTFATLAIAATLTGCAPTPEPTRTPAPIQIALEYCISAHPETGEYANPDGEGHITQTAAESCARWLNNVGEQQFIDTWTAEYADTYREAFG